MRGLVPPVPPSNASECGYYARVGTKPLHIDLSRLTAAVSLLAGIVEGSDDAIIAKDIEGRIIAWNPAARRLFGYSEDEAIGQHVDMLIPLDHRGEDQLIFRRILDGEPVAHYETQRLTKSGKVVNVSVTVSPIRDTDGSVVGASKIIRDISTQLSASAAQAQLAAIIESSDDAIISKDRSWRIRSWNPAAERLFGYTPDEIIGKHVSVLFPEDLQGRERDILSEIIAGKKVDHYETRRVTKYGKILHVSLTVSPLRNADGEIVGASKIVRDISERKEAEDRIRHAERLTQINEQLAAADRAKDQFFAMANHELRTPLTSIAGFTDTLLRLDERLDADSRREYLQIIDRQASRLTTLVEDLLTLSKVQGDSDEVKAETFAVAPAIEQLLVDTKRDDVVVNIDPHLKVCADEQQFHQMLANYLDNATKYGDGTVEVCARNGGGNVVLEVRDRGSGVPDELMPRLFGRFSRGQAVAQAGIPGTGLGLAIVRGLARAQGGDAWYEPREPRGSAFCIRLPAGN
jgi:PAS domain S-box-containing protein